MGKGRPPKPVNVLKLTGTFRKDRHAARAAIPEPDGTPKKPSFIKGEAANEWNRIMPELMRLKVVGESDTSLVIAVCEQWGNYREAQDLLSANVGNKENKCAMNDYLANYQALRSKLGLTPIDRTKLKVDVSDKPSGVSGFARNRG